MSTLKQTTITIIVFVLACTIVLSFLGLVWTIGDVAFFTPWIFLRIAATAMVGLLVMCIYDMFKNEYDVAVREDERNAKYRAIEAARNNRPK